jgi:hypothetical protein
MIHLTSRTPYGLVLRSGRERAVTEHQFIDFLPARLAQERIQNFVLGRRPGELTLGHPVLNAKVRKGSTHRMFEIRIYDFWISVSNACPAATFFSTGRELGLWKT